MASPTITKIAYEKRYSDDSGVEFSVAYDATQSEPIRLEHINAIEFPIEQLDWLIETLQDIKYKVK